MAVRCKPLTQNKTSTRLLDYIATISFGRILYCGCFNLFCNVWSCVCVGVLVIYVLVFPVLCIVCTVYFVFFRLCIFILICFFLY